MFEDKESSEKYLKRLVSDLILASCENSKDGKCDYTSETLIALEALSEIKPVWIIESLPVDPLQIDRRSNMFGGRPFTSQKHPWPSNKKKNPYYPLIQIDLRQVSRIAGKDFGHGLMQVWLDITKDSLADLIRIIDKEDFDDAVAEDFPNAKSIQKIDEFNSWFGISSNFSFKPSGFMMAHWFDGSAEWDYARDLSEREIGILNELEKLSEENGYKSLSSNWLLGKV